MDIHVHVVLIEDAAIKEFNQTADVYYGEKYTSAMAILGITTIDFTKTKSGVWLLCCGRLLHRCL